VTCRTVTKEVVTQVPVTTCRMESYTVTYKVCRRVPYCVPECTPHPTLGPGSSLSAPPATEATGEPVPVREEE
jgi:hypothetical protein